jgi:hypothetical protein
MQELLLRREIFGKVLDGSKKSTSRKGKRDIIKGELLFKMTENEAEQVCVNVNNVRYLPYCEISEEEAIKEGYKSLSDLKEILTKIYGEIDPNEIFTFVEWE